MSQATETEREEIEAMFARGTTRLSVRLPTELIERMRNAVDALQGPPERLRMKTGFAMAVLDFVEWAEHKHNKGKPFPQRPGNLKPGRG